MALTTNPPTSSATSLAHTAALHGMTVFVQTFAGDQYVGTAEGVTGSLATTPSLVIRHENGEGSPIGADRTFVPLEAIAEIAADGRRAGTLFGTAEGGR